MVFAEFASASIWLRTNISQIMVNKRLVPMQSVLLLLSPLTAYILSIFDRKCINRVLRYVIYFISRPTEIAILLGSPYLELSQGLSKQTAGPPRRVTLPKATFTLHRYSFGPLHSCYGSSASTLPDQNCSSSLSRLHCTGSIRFLAKSMRTAGITLHAGKEVRSETLPKHMFV